MSAPETEARNSLIALLKVTFMPEGLDVRDDRIHPSLGQEGPIAAVYPARSVAWRHDKLVTEYYLIVQFFNQWEKIVDPKQTVSPSIIEGFAERFRKALKGETDIAKPAIWYFDLERIDYPHDPTENITRFEATVIARGNNTALMETV